MDCIALLVAATLNAGTVLAFAALGLLINERAGIVNLGAEGMMLVAAVAGFATVVHTGNDWLGFGAGALAGALLAAAFGVLVIWLNTNQYATGLALSLFGVGFSAFVGIRYTQEKLGERPTSRSPAWPTCPSSGRRCSASIRWSTSRSPSRSRSPGSSTARAPGLVLRAVGESPESAHALGYPVRRIRFAAVMFGGALCGVSGAYISTVYTPLWVEGMIAGKGWIALALTTFATWRPARVLLGAYLFGGVTMLQFHLQGEGVQVPSQFLTMLPYLATIVVLVLISRNASFIRVNMPASIGKPFFPGVDNRRFAAGRSRLPSTGATMTDSRNGPSSNSPAGRCSPRSARWPAAARNRRRPPRPRRRAPRRPRRPAAPPAGRLGAGRRRPAEDRLRLRRPGRRRRLDLRARQRPQGGREAVRRQGRRPASSRRCPRRPTPSACSATWSARATS